MNRPLQHVSDPHNVLAQTTRRADRLADDEELVARPGTEAVLPVHRDVGRAELRGSAGVRGDLARLEVQVFPVDDGVTPVVDGPLLGWGEVLRG